MTRDLLEILALALLICQQATWAEAQSRHGNNSPANNLRESVQIDLSSDEQQQPQQQQQQQQQMQYDPSSNAEVQGPQDNLKKYLLRGECDTPDLAKCPDRKSIKLNPSLQPPPPPSQPPQLSLDPTDLDFNGYMLKKSPRDQWRLFQLKELLDTLSSAIPTPSPIAVQLQQQQQQQPPSSSSFAFLSSPLEPSSSRLAGSFLPIYRSSRNKPSASPSASGLSTGEDLLSARSSPYFKMASYSNLGPEMTADKNIKERKQSVLGLDWGAGIRPSLGSAVVTVRRSEGDRAQALRHPMGSEEVAAFTPIHSRSTSDYEWKRVENLSKWNNLRGMWGKRSNLSPLIDNHNQPGPSLSNRYLASLENQQVM